MTLIAWTLVIAVLTAIACALCGTFLVVKNEAMTSEGLSHAVLPGIIIGFLIFQDRNSPLLILSAGLMGLLMVALVQAIHRTRLVDRDASLGIVFSALFSIGVILSSQKLRDVHFHAECIIDGNLASAALKTFRWGDLELGPTAFFVMLTTLIFVLGFVLLFWKELKIMCFDEGLAGSLGFRPTTLHMAWLAIVSVTTVVAFEVAGSILVVALMIAPPAAAFLLTSRLSHMLVVSSLIAIASAILGFYAALHLDISPAGPIAFVSGLIFLMVLVLAPSTGLISKIRLRKNQQAQLFERLLLQQIDNSSKTEISIEEAFEACSWNRKQLDRAIKNCESRHLIRTHSDQLGITSEGKKLLREAEHQDSAMRAMSNGLEFGN